MNRQDKQKDLFPSITEWMKHLNVPGTEKFQKEDFTKRDRLKILNQTINLPFLRATSIKPNTKKNIIAEISSLNERDKDGIYLFKIFPTNNSLGKIRLQKTLVQCIDWVSKTRIDTKKFRYELIKEPEKITHSAVFCIDEKGIWGELIKDHIIHFSRGTYKGETLVFYYDYKKWHFSNRGDQSTKLIKKAVGKLHLHSTTKIKTLKKLLHANFTQSNHLKGYFEFIVDNNNNINFVDYNRILNRLLKKTIITITRHTDYLNGICIGPGKIKGKIKKIRDGNQKIKFQKNEILVSPLVTFQHLPYIKKAGGIITEQGTVLSHAAIVSRELKKPYVANVKDAMKKLKDGDLVTVDADQGKIIIHQKTK